MTAISFLVFARGSGSGFPAFARRLRDACRPGDQVVILDDGSEDDTARQVLRFEEREGWPEGVTVQNLLCDRREKPQHRPGLDPMVGLCLSRARQGYVAFLDACDQPKADHLTPGVWFDRARSLTGLQVDGVVGGFPAGPLTRQQIEMRPASLFNTLWRRSALIPDMATTSPPPETEIGAIWNALRPGRRLVGLPQSFATEQLPRPTATFARAVTQLWQAGPDTAEARHWLAWHLPAILAGLKPGAMTGLLGAISEDAPALGTLLRFRRATGANGPRQTLREALRSFRLPAPAPVGRAHLSVALLGPHAKRMPLSYAALADLWKDRVSFTPAARADLILFAHPRDVDQIKPPLAEALARRPRPVALFSEEPFWDSLFSPDPLADAVTLRAGAAGELRLAQINHHSSDVYDFDRIPYYLLTNHRFANSYATRFARNARLSAAQWAAAFASRPTRTLFMAERRTEPFHNLRFADGDLVGLCAWRSEVTSACQSGGVRRLGRGWAEGPTRFELIDWHLDKMVRLDGAARQISGLENTHQPCYISEKLFDAFACGARPIYFASPGHRVHHLGLPAAAWLNLWDMSVPDAAARVDQAGFDPAFFAAFAQAQQHLAALFGQTRHWVSERQRLQQAVNRALDKAASGPAAVPV